MNGKQIFFDHFCLDRDNQCLWQGSLLINLRPKVFAVLDYLLSHPGQLVTKERLLNAVWPETFVGEAVLKVAVRQLREALGDDPKSPRFIETAHRRGYRFIGRITKSEPGPAADQEIRSDYAVAPSPPRGATSSPGFVGRDAALARLHGWLEKMLHGKRQLVFVTGEAGIGKTTLVDTFAHSLTADRQIRIGRGQCLEHYGTGEAYLPVLEAVSRLARESTAVLEVLRAHAPMWLLQMPWHVSAAERGRLSREMMGANRERMLREMGDALEVLSAEVPLLLIIEDLHWGDYSTLDLLSYLARQRQAAQLLVLGTYRTVELIVSGHPLKAVKQEWLAKQQCEEMPLDDLGENAIAEYLSSRFPANQFPAELASLIHDRTEGNPLFMVNVVDYLVAEGLIAETGLGWELVAEIGKVEVGVPDSIRQMIEKQLDNLGAQERLLLEAASVAGAEFPTPAVAAGLGEDVVSIEARCEALARQHQFIHDCGVQVLPNGETVGRYGFIHALYRNVLYERVAAARRLQLHRRIAEQGEVIYGERVREIAGELAMHYEQGREYGKAAKYLQQAADNAIRRFAYKEAVSLARRGLELLERLPEGEDRARQELCLQLTLGVPLIATEGYAAPEVGSVYLRARELCQQLGETPDISESLALWGLWTFYTLRAELGTAREIAEEFLRLAERLPYPGLLMWGHSMMQVTFTHLGQLAPAMEHFEKALSFYDPERHLDDAFLYTQHPEVAMPGFAAWALWSLGQPDQAVERIEQALGMARHLGEPHGLAHAYFFAAVLHHFRREPQQAQEQAEAAIAVSSYHGLAMYQAHSTMMRGWALLEQGQQEEAIAQMRQGLADQQATGTELARPHFLALLGEALGRSGLFEEGLRVLNEALEMAHHGDRDCQAESYRLKGELLLIRSTGRGICNATADETAVAEAEDCFQQAIEVAQQQQAKSWELRAVMSLARLYQQQGKQEEARSLLADIYNQFTEGFETMDLREAKALLNEWAMSQHMNN